MSHFFKPYLLPTKRVVENQPQAPGKDVQLRYPLLLPPSIEIWWLGRIVSIRVKKPLPNKNHPDLLQTLIKHIQYGFGRHPTKPTTPQTVTLPSEPIFLVILNTHLAHLHISILTFIVEIIILVIRIIEFVKVKVLVRVGTQNGKGRREANLYPDQIALALLVFLFIVTVIAGVVTEW